LVVPHYQADSYALLTRPPLAARPKPALPLDLHVLGMPPAFNLSHDQTLQFNLLITLSSDLFIFDVHARAFTSLCSLISQSYANAHTNHPVC
jgi:hypothetical protein